MKTDVSRSDFSQDSSNCFFLEFKHYGFVLLALFMHSVILIWIDVQSHFMQAYAVLHVQKKICMGGLRRDGVMRDTIICVLELLVKCRNIITFYTIELIRISFSVTQFHFEQ